MDLKLRSALVKIDGAEGTTRLLRNKRGVLAEKGECWEVVPRRRKYRDSRGEKVVRMVEIWYKIGRSRPQKSKNLKELPEKGRVQEKMGDYPEKGGGKKKEGRRGCSPSRQKHQSS